MKEKVGGLKRDLILKYKFDIYKWFWFECKIQDVFTCSM